MCVLDLIFGSAWALGHLLCNIVYVCKASLAKLRAHRIMDEVNTLQQRKYHVIFAYFLFEELYFTPISLQRRGQLLATPRKRLDYLLNEIEGILLDPFSG